MLKKAVLLKIKRFNAEVIKNVVDFAITTGYSVKGLTYSSIKGPSGNIEYLIWLSTEREGFMPDIENVVKEAFEVLN